MCARFLWPDREAAALEVSRYGCLGVIYAVVIIE